jgi:hypothetical protein
LSGTLDLSSDTSALDVPSQIRGDTEVLLGIPSGYHNRDTSVLTDCVRYGPSYEVAVKPPAGIALGLAPVRDLKSNFFEKP